MKTAMQELNEFLMKPEPLTFTNLLQKVAELKVKERQQIEEAYATGFDAADPEEGDAYGETYAPLYYNNTYGNDNT